MREKVKHCVTLRAEGALSGHLHAILTSCAQIADPKSTEEWSPLLSPQCPPGMFQCAHQKNELENDCFIVNCNLFVTSLVFTKDWPVLTSCL
ncbi:hypothetical protein ACOMHN_048899 [Nucella lapillus]